MPTYQYACTNPECGNQFELVQSFTDPTVSTCPVCGQPVRKRYGSVGVVFKGSGFYRTDSRAAASASSPSKTESSSENKSSSESKSSEKKSEPASTGSSSSSSSSSSGSSGSSKAAASA